MAEVHHLIFARPGDLPAELREQLDEHWASIDMALRTAVDLLYSHQVGHRPTEAYFAVARRIVEDAQESMGALRRGEAKFLSGRLRRDNPAPTGAPLPP